MNELNTLTIDNILPNKECTYIMIHYFIFIIILLVFGALGGIARGSYDRLSSEAKKPNDYEYYSWKNITKRINFWLQYIFLGIGGGACAILLALLLSRYQLNINDLSSVILYSCISCLGGIVAKGCLPVLESQINKKMKGVAAEIETKVEEKTKQIIKKEVEEVGEKAENAVNYTKLISDADTALQEDNSSSFVKIYINKAIENMEKNIEKYPVDRHFNIKFARLYRKEYEVKKATSSLDKAILILRNYINSLNHSSPLVLSDKLNQATAYFNIACYHSLKIESCPKEKERLLKEIVLSLEEAYNLDKLILTEIKEDEDLKPNIDEIIKSDIFKKLLD